MRISKPRTRSHHEEGYALLMVVFMVATMILIASAATTSVLTQGRREMEKEIVWRGQQYQRAIGLYYVKFGHYPTKIEDLTRLTNGVRFLRQAYTDPMNKDDGSWRFIHVVNGQLVDSLRQSSLLQNTLTSSSITGASPFGGGLQPVFPPQQTNQGPGGATTLTGAGGSAGTGGVGLGGQQGGNPASAPNPLEAQPQPLQGDVIGGQIAGVGSKIKQPSFRVYQGGDTYQLWEFIWTPNQNGAIPSANPNPAGAQPTSAPNQQPQNQQAPGPGPMGVQPPQ